VAADYQSLYNEQYFAAYVDDPARDEMQRQEFHQRLEKWLNAYWQPAVDRALKAENGSAVIGHVLDIGCGLGRFLDWYFVDVSRYINVDDVGIGAITDFVGWHKYGIEISEHARAIANKKGIRFHWLEGKPEQFDLIILRGSLQHLDRPLDTLHNCYEWLKPGGLIALLATPNAGSVVYRLWGSMPMLDPARNFVVLSDAQLTNCLKHIGFDVLEVHYPYRGTPYARPLRDAWRFALRLLGIRRLPFAWPRNMMEVYARKPGGEQ